jgi:hypothetical protein
LATSAPVLPAPSHTAAPAVRIHASAAVTPVTPVTPGADGPTASRHHGVRPESPLAVVTVPVQGGTSILALTLTVPVVGVHVSASVSLPGGISLAIGAGPETPGTPGTLMPRG